jgi:hypothetical protein
MCLETPKAKTKCYVASRFLSKVGPGSEKIMTGGDPSSKDYDFCRQLNRSLIQRVTCWSAEEGLGTHKGVILTGI